MNINTVNNKYNVMDETLLGVSPPQKNLSNPYATLYLKRTSVGPKLINTIVHIKNLLQLKGIDEEEIEEIFLNEDEQRLKDVLEKANGKEEFPIIFIQDVYIGNVNDLEDWVVSEKLDTLLEKLNSARPRSPSRVEKQTQALSRHIQDIKQQKQLLEEEMQKSNNHDAIEELKSSIFLLDKDIHSMSTILSKNEEKLFKKPQPEPPSSLVTSLFGNLVSSVTNYWSWSTPATSPPKEYKDSKGSNYSEFEVMQINWYWRQQKRILRLGKDRIIRINPYSKELRAMHYYRNIKEIVISGNTFMTLYFNDTSHAEYYQSVDLLNIVNKLLEKASPMVIPVSYVKE